MGSPLFDSAERRRKSLNKIILAVLTALVAICAEVIKEKED